MTSKKLREQFEKEHPNGLYKLIEISKVEEKKSK